jgi:hypothetical protein
MSEISVIRTAKGDAESFNRRSETTKVPMS